jgi:prevent-host-death family protein
MKTANIADLKNNLSRYLVAVQQGEEVLVKDRDKPVAKIVPIRLADDETAELTALAAEGKVSLPAEPGGVTDDLLTAKLPRAKTDVQRFLREDRDAR